MIQVDFFSDGLETTNQGCVFMILFCKARKLTKNPASFGLDLFGLAFWEVFRGMVSEKLMFLVEFVRDDMNVYLYTSYIYIHIHRCKFSRYKLPEILPAT